MTARTPVLQVAAKALIVNATGKVLVVREASTGKNNTKVGLFGLVGGRLEPGESFQEGLRREIQEETSLHIQPVRPLHVGEWRPVIREIQHQIIAIFMLCNAISDAVQLSEEHDEYRWLDPFNLAKVPLMEPDGQVIRDYAQSLRKAPLL